MGEQDTPADNVARLHFVADVISNAKAADDDPALSKAVAAVREKERPPAPDSGTPDSGGALTGHPEGDGPQLPATCPVTPLGKGPGVCYYLDASRQLIALKAKDHSRLGIQDLFGARNFVLPDFWPRRNKEGDVIGFDADKAARDLMADAARAGVWSPLEKVRGPGAWRLGDGGLALHCGDVVFAGGRSHPPGMIGRHVYPAAEPLPRPANERAGADAGAALFQLLRTWNWRRPDVDPLLMLGWIVAAMAGGALKWRPVVWVTGGAGTGKSTLHDEVLKRLYGLGIVDVSDATGAGIWQKLGYATLPVAVDELESEEDGRKVDQVVRLARQAASGGVVLRGGADHKGSEFIARSCFLFSSIIVPPLEPQDESRIAILELKPLGHGTKGLTIADGQLEQLGSALKRRLLDRWPQLIDALEVYREALAKVGYDARGRDQYGTLLACAHLALVDTDADAGNALGFAEKIKAGEAMRDAERVSDEEAMLSRLLSTTHEHYKDGHKRTIGDWVKQAAGMKSTLDAEAAQAALMVYGLRVVDDHDDDGNPRKYLAIANRSEGLAKIFDSTKWKAKHGRTGGWVQTARRIEGHKTLPRPLYVGHTVRVTLVPLDVVLPPEAAAQDHETGDGAAGAPPPPSTDIEDDIPF